MPTHRGPFVRLLLCTRRTIMPTIVHDDSNTQQRDRRPLTYRSRDQAGRWIGAERRWLISVSQQACEGERPDSVP